jgi:hypothetical protein
MAKKKLHIQGALIIYHSGVLGYVVMIDNWSPKGTSFEVDKCAAIPTCMESRSVSSAVVVRFL